MINKILFTIFAVIAIWKAFSMISKLAGGSGGVLSRREGDGREGAARSGDPKAVELQPCPRCGAYVDPRERCRCQS